MAIKKPAIFKKPAPSGGGSAPAKKPILKNVGASVKKAVQNPALKKVVKVGAAVATGGASLLATKKGQAAVKKVAKKVATKTSAVASKVGEAGKVAALIALFGPLAPIARKFLKRRGVTPAKDTKALIVQVNNEKSKKSFGYQGGDAFDYGMTDAQEFGYYDHLGLEHSKFGFIPITPGMVTGVIEFLKNILGLAKQKQANGEPLSADEKELIQEAPAIEQNLTEAKQTASAIVEKSEQEAAQIVSQGAAEAGAAASAAGASDQEARKVMAQVATEGAQASGIEPEKAQKVVAEAAESTPGGIMKYWKMILVIIIVFILWAKFLR